jgi:hypothetical protein
MTKHAIKAQVAKINWKIMPSNFPCFVLTSSVYFAGEKSGQGSRHYLNLQPCACLYLMVPTTSAGPQMCLAKEQYVSAT